MSCPGTIRISSDKSVSAETAVSLGLGPVMERMITLTDHLGRLQLDQCEYVCLKVIILLTSGKKKKKMVLIVLTSDLLFYL